MRGRSARWSRRFGIGWVVMGLGLAPACFQGVDVSKISCGDDDHCPSGYRCEVDPSTQLKRCKSLGHADSGTPSRADAPPSDSPLSTDVPESTTAGGSNGGGAGSGAGGALANGGASGASGAGGSAAPPVTPLRAPEGSSLPAAWPVSAAPSARVGSWLWVAPRASRPVVSPERPVPEVRSRQGAAEARPVRRRARCPAVRGASILRRTTTTAAGATSLATRASAASLGCAAVTRPPVRAVAARPWVRASTPPDRASRIAGSLERAVFPAHPEEIASRALAPAVAV